MLDILSTLLAIRSRVFRIIQVFVGFTNVLDFLGFVFFMVFSFFRKHKKRKPAGREETCFWSFSFFDFFVVLYFFFQDAEK